MSNQYHWVVVYDEDWGAFMVDAEGELLDRDRLLYNKESGKWEYLEEDTEQEAEYFRLEEILAYNLTRLDIPKKVGQDTHMKTVKTSITFYTTPELDPVGYDDMTDEELMEYAKACFHDDIVSFVKYNELMDVISTEIIND